MQISPQAIAFMLKPLLQMFGVDADKVGEQINVLLESGAIEKIVAFAEALEEQNRLLREILDGTSAAQTSADTGDGIIAGREPLLLPRLGAASAGRGDAGIACSLVDGDRPLDAPAPALNRG